MTLLDHRVVIAGGHLDGPAANDLTGQLMLLDSAGSRPVTLHLRIRDADLSAALAVVDTIDTLRCPVHAVAAGEVGGPALAVLAAARRREMTRHAMLRLREPTAEFDGTADNVAAWEAQHTRLVDAFYIRLAEVTRREVDEIRDDCRAGRLLTAEDAVAYGLVQAIAVAPGP